MRYLLLALCFSAPLLAEQKIVINLPSYELTLLEDNEPVMTLPCYIGKPNTPTRIGAGTITDKRPAITFYYTQGERKGERIEESHLTPENRTIPMPYDKMRALGVDIDGHLNQVVHATTNYWKIGTASSNGCVGLRVNDMLRLYNAVQSEPLPTVTTTYETIRYTPHNGKVRIYADVYQRGSNTVEALFSHLKRNGISVEALDRDSVATNLRIIDERLRVRNPQYRRALEEGRLEEAEQLALYFSMPLTDLVTPSHHDRVVVTGTLEPGETLYKALVKRGWSAGQVMRLTKALKGKVNLEHLFPEDLFEIQMEDGVVTRFTLVHHGEVQTVDVQALMVSKQVDAEA